MDSDQQPIPDLLCYPRNLKYCCIYKVQDSIREVHPEAYTPRLVVIGPLHRSLISQALAAHVRREDITFTRSMGYLEMEQLKKIYLQEFTERRFVGEEMIREFRRTIKEEEENIRGSYSLPTTWMKSSEFVEMVLKDSVFIMEYILKDQYMGYAKTGDLLTDDPTLARTVSHDLILLENQLPYFILEKLFAPLFPNICPTRTFQNLVLSFFQFEGKITEDFKVGHFTDLHRHVLLQTHPKYHDVNSGLIKHIYNADKLESGGVKFEAIEEEFSMNVRFENGCLKMSLLTIDDEFEIILRNIMALEKCHYPNDDPVCSYVLFLDNLIDNKKDVDLLVEKGILANSTGKPAAVSRMVNKLGLGIIENGSYYSDMAVEVNDYSKKLVNKSKAILKHVYFVNPWVWIGTMTAIALVVMAIIQTQVKEDKC